MSKAKQITTELNEDPFEKLDDHHQQAVEMRLENFAYRDIAAHVQKSEQTVRWWFIRGGICQEAYDYKLKQRAEDRDERAKQIQNQLDSMAADAVNVLKRSMRRGSETAAIRVLELAGFTPVQKHKDVTKSKELELLEELVTRHERTDQPVPAERSTN